MMITEDPEYLMLYTKNLGIQTRKKVIESHMTALQALINELTVERKSLFDELYSNLARMDEIAEESPLA